MEAVSKFIRERIILVMLMVFVLGILGGLFLFQVIHLSGSSKSSLAVLSPKTDEEFFGIVPIRAYFKTPENAYILSAEYKIDESTPKQLNLTRINAQEIAMVGAWDSTLEPGKKIITISLYKALKNGGKALLAQTKVPVVSILLYP